MLDVRGMRKPSTGRGEVAGQDFVEGGGGVEPGDAAGTVQAIADVVEPDDLPVGRVEQRHAEPAEAEGAVLNPFGVALRLRQDVLGPQGHALRLDNAQRPATDEKGVVGGAVGCREPGNSVVGVPMERATGVEKDDLPPLPGQLGVDSGSASPGFGFFALVAGHRNLPLRRAELRVDPGLVRISPTCSLHAGHPARHSLPHWVGLGNHGSGIATRAAGG